MSFKGIGLRIFALILGVVAIIAGIYINFFQTKGFEKTKATITSIEEKEDEFSTDSDRNIEHVVTVEYSVNGNEYEEVLDFYSPTFKEGSVVEVLYNPANPSEIHSNSPFRIIILIIGIVIVLVVVISFIRGKLLLRKLKETESIGKSRTYQPTLPGEERELYFLTDLGTPKYGHRIEDSARRVLYEAKMTKFNVTAPYEFDFIDHEHGRTTAHLVGHEEESEINSILFDNHYTFALDGEDIWKHLKRNNIRVDSSLGGGSGKLLGVNYVIYHNDVELARVESTSQFVHEEDEEKHKVAKGIPVKGFFRIRTRATNLEVLFVTLLAFARTEASAANGGNRRTIINTIKNAAKDS